MSIKKQKLFGNKTPYAFVLEATHGCNLRCGHCSCRKDPLPKTYKYMSVETAKQAAIIFQAVNPTARLDICGCGEPTLNPYLIDIIHSIREIVPQMQIQVTTNGTQISTGKVSSKDLLDAGANFIYLDMYAPKERHIELARQTGYQYYEYYNAPQNALSPWMYHGDTSIKQIILQENPSNWPKTRKSANLLGTWFNHLDWNAAKQFGMKPIIKAPNRRCNQPFVYTIVDACGNYLLCGQDGVGETSGQLGNVSSGLEGYKEFWFSPFMQMVRRNLHDKYRSLNPHCCRCAVTFSRCDYIHWEEDDLVKWYAGGRWHTLTHEHSIQYNAQVKKLKRTIGQDGLPTEAWAGFIPSHGESSKFNNIPMLRKQTMREDFCVFILTHGRPDRVHTYKTLLDAGYTGKIFIVIDDEDKTAGEYRQLYGDKVLQFCKREVAERIDEGDNFNDRRAIIYARNVCWELARKVGCRYFIQLDDDYTNFSLRFDSKGDGCSIKITHLDDALLAMLDFLKETPSKTICMAQTGELIGGTDQRNGGNTRKLRRKAMNSFICDIEKPFEFMGRINEDVNTYILGGLRGDLFFTALQILLTQIQTQANKGGMSDLYIDSGTYVKSFYSIMYAPACVKIGILGDWRSPHFRIHHKINWHNTAPKILQEEMKKTKQDSGGAAPTVTLQHEATS